MKRRAIPAALVLALAALALSGCGDNAAENAAESAIEKAAEEQGEDVDVDIDADGGEVKIDTKDGTIEAGTGELPDDFPIGRADLVDGEIQSAASISEGFSVAIVSSASVDDAAAMLEDAGYTSVPSGGAAALLEGDGYQVIIQQVGPAISYTIAPK
jgi:hypothetical protein